MIDEMEKHMGEDVQKAAENNTYENFRYSFTARLMDFIVSNIEAKEDYMKLLEALALVDEYVSRKVYNDVIRGPGYLND